MYLPYFFRSKIFYIQELIFSGVKIQAEFEES